MSDNKQSSKLEKSAGRVRIGVDVGGTFTDFVLIDDERNFIHTGKRLTTPGDPSRAIIEGVERLVTETETALAAVDAVVHGTTLVTNTVIERKGAKVGLLTTKGFRDSLEMGKETRYDLYDLFFEKPEPLVPRYLREEVRERLNSDGEVLEPLTIEDVKAAGERLLAEGCEAFAICFLHSYRNDIHEQQARDVLRTIVGDRPICTSAEVAPEIREFERGNTACANAYVQPLMQSYLERLEQQLRERGLKGSLHVMLSGGGLTTIRAASEFPIRLIESGPAAGAMAATFYSAITGVKDLISFDMGGTTAKMCIIENGQPEHAHEFEAARVRRFRKGSGLPLKVPVVDLIEIGAGGGSIARVDQMGLLKVGPDSASSEPGPVCYRRGGTEPTVTDADLLLGYLSPDYFLGGEMTLDIEHVRNALREKVAAQLNMDVETAAAGIHSIVNENMASATRMYIAEKGKDPRRYSMIAFGGAGPVHAYELARLLKLKKLIVPLGAGVMSALGFLVAPFGIDYVRSYISRVDQIDWNHLNRLFAEMEHDARALLVEAGAKECTIVRQADMRCVGQGFEIKVDLPACTLSADNLPQIREAFYNTYEQLFGRRPEDVPIEALSWRLAAVGEAPKIRLRFDGIRTGDAKIVKGTRKAHFAGHGYVNCNVYDRYALRPGTKFDGPAIVEERESTVIVGPDGQVSVDEHLNLIVNINYNDVEEATSEQGSLQNGNDR
ncbi:hydantoinase/oxoprolinase family protein [Paraburkholderia aspalathi]|uniref:hydantoinase/oxoprolinase family protein n=1 Tax=Paraburkholderia aspalathi TaxID=1324617 RepID=UPI001B20F5F3|nr:hydantoinase/oxoprolinase family protein [Paraburkholderia aspalathi]CAE6738108.1 Acetophenone carboxylase gamma subunit [Paraburkholderia aspalathi]